MIGSLMYLIASRPDIQFSTCLCARYKANPKESHLVVVKRIFRYLKGTPNLGLWYLKEPGFNLKAYSDSDYAGCDLDRKSTLGVFQILCGNQLADYDVLYDKVPIFSDNTSAISISNNPVLHSRTKHIDIREPMWQLQRPPSLAMNVEGWDILGMNARNIKYPIELVNRRLIGSDIVIRGCTLGFLGHPFNIDLMLVELGSFDVIIGMNWLANHHAVIVCDEKIVQIPYGDEVLIVQSDRVEKETEDKSEKKRLEDVSTVQDFSEVFPKDFPGLPPTRQVEFQIDLVPGAAPVARAPYRFAPLELQELST
ncbi:putative reverse transcriptase domain-containing protein [Tanacetum coccineum]